MALPMHCTRVPEDRPNGRSAPQLGDLVAALYVAIGICSALYNRKQTGEGHYIDIALVDGIFSVLENTVPAYLNCGLKPGRLGNRHPNGGPYDTYKAKDGYVAVVASNERLWLDQARRLLAGLFG